jgi:hypothetical protein
MSLTQSTDFVSVDRCLVVFQSTISPSQSMASSGGGDSGSGDVLGAESSLKKARFSDCISHMQALLKLLVLPKTGAFALLTDIEVLAKCFFPGQNKMQLRSLISQAGLKQFGSSWGISSGGESRKPGQCSIYNTYASEGSNDRH